MTETRTEARVFKVTTSLARDINEPGGRLVRHAARLADEGLNTHREEAIEDLRSALDAMEALCAEAREDDGPGLYDLASSVVGLAGFFDTGAFFEAAYSLCETADHMITAGAWRWPLVEVHLQGLRRILLDDFRHDPSHDALLIGLRAISQPRPG